MNSKAQINNNSHNFLGQYLTPFQRKLLQKNLTNDLPEQYRQRLEIMLLVDEAKTQSEICQIVGCCAATARHWIMIAKSGQAHQWQDSPIGRPKAVNQQYLERLKELVSQSPRDCGYAFRRWTAQWLSKHLSKEFGVEISDRHINRLLKEMGLSTKAKLMITETNKFSESKERISIADLPHTNTSEFRDFWSFNPINLSLS